MGMTLKHNIKNRKFIVGGSSISQQLIKNSMLSGERTIYRKIEEAILSLLMENYYKLSKNDILEIYLNMIEFAPGVYGIEDASQFYFGKHCENLSVCEVLAMTYIIPRPIHFYNALRQHTTQLKNNLYKHICHFYRVLTDKKIINETDYDFNDLNHLVFVPDFGILKFIDEENTREITEIIIHCTATTEGCNFTVNDIRKWHIERGFDDIGYHWIIYLDGSVHQGRLESIIGAHCHGHNNNSIGICYVGGLDSMGKPKNTLNTEQEKSLKDLCNNLIKKYPNAEIHGHNEFSSKDCPCFDVQKWINQDLISKKNI